METPKKYQLLRDYLLIIKKKKKKYNKKYIRLKKLYDRSEIVIKVSSAVTVCSIVLTVSLPNPVTLGVSTAFSTIGALTTAATTAYRLSVKLEKLKSSIDNYSGLERYIELILNSSVNHKRLDLIITDIGNRLDLIEEHALVISESSSPEPTP